MSLHQPNWRKGLRIWVPTLLVLIVFALALVAVHHMLATVKFDDVVAEFRSISVATVVFAVLATALGYFSMVGYDWTALRFIGREVPFPTIVIGSFTGYALGNTIGLSVVSGGLARYRVYSAYGLDGTDVAIVSAISAASLGTGVLVVGLGGLVIDPDALQGVVAVDRTVVRGMAIAAIVAAVATAVWFAMRGREIEVAGHRIPLPTADILGPQLICAILDVVFAGATLFILLPESAGLSFPVFLVVYAVAVVAAALSHVPGGVGVFEMVIIGALSASLPLDGIASALIAYRVIYYLLPFGLALLIIAVHEALLRRQKLAGAVAGGKRAADSVFAALGPLVPHALSAMVFLAGLFLVLAGILPVPAAATDAAELVLRLVSIEISTLAAGIIGMALIVVAFGVRQKVQAAYAISLALLLFGAISIFIQRGALWPTVVLLLSAGILFATRGAFKRDSRLTHEIWSPAWFGLVAMVIVSACFVGFFVHKDAAYAQETWWQFAHDGHLPRYLRVGTAITVVAFLTVLWTVLQPIRLRPQPDISEDRETLEKIVQSQGHPDANFVFTGDKSILLNDDKTAYVMYGIHGKYWVALGDPIGAKDDFSDLIRNFIAMAERYNCRAVFYQVSDSHLPIYLDLGFVLSKLGEEAVVPLSEFGLEGKSHRSLRSAHNRAERAGLSFSVVQPPHDAQLMERLRQISDEWLSSKHAREKSFSLGRFDEDYLQLFPIAVVEAEGQVIAFANVLLTGTKDGSTVDLMRHCGDAPNGTMEYLFVELMLSLKQGGYSHFSLGLAPLSGLGGKHIKRTWDRFGVALYRFGGHFYNFDGLRKFKEKFRPEWHSRYLASAGGADPLLSLRAINALIAGSIKGALSK